MAQESRFRTTVTDQKVRQLLLPTNARMDVSKSLAAARGGWLIHGGVTKAGPGLNAPSVREVSENLWHNPAQYIEYRESGMQSD